MRTMLSIALVAAYVLSLTGCGSSGGPTTYSVTGSVSLGGSPIEEGSIVFDPADGRGGSAMGGIKNGQFTAKVPAGEKILRISAVRTTGELDQYGAVVSESYIPAKYDTESTIRKTVSADGPNKFDLELD
jgi:hypothetical protein